MGLRINTNIAAMNSYRSLSNTDKSMSSSLEKLSSGYRINKAADDAAGLSISEGLQSQIGGLTVAARNAQDGVNVAQTADGSLGESEAILQRMRDLAVQASNNGSQDSDAKAASQAEFSQLADELTKISTTTKFGNQALLGGAYNGTFQVGANAGETRALDLSTANTTLFGSSTATGFDATGLGVDTLDLTTDASSAITAVDNAIKGVSSARSYIGGVQNRLEHTINNINVTNQNLTASNSAIQDTDMAKEMVSFTRSQILTQAGTSMLAQANSASQSVLKLLG